MKNQDIFKLGKQLYYLKQMSATEIDGKKIDLTLQGTYSEIRKKYVTLAKIFHPDVYKRK